MRRILLASLLVLGCSKRDEAPPVSADPPAAPMASAVKEYAVELLTCTNGVLGTVPAQSVGSNAVAPASAIVSAAPAASASAAPPASASGALPSMSAAGLGSLLAPIGEGGVGFGAIGHYDGGVGYGYGGFGPGPRRPRAATIIGVPSIDRDERARMVALSMCSTGLALRRCHAGAESPAGDLELALKIEPTGRVAAVDRLAGSITDQAFVSCLRAAILEKNFTPAASGITRYRLTFEAPNEPPSPVVTGALAPELVRRVMHRQLPKLNYCYEARLKSVPTLAGSVVAEFVIDKYGKVVSVKTSEGTLPDEPTRACVAKAIMAVEFPEPKGSGIVTVKYPLSFKPG